ncbi:hypothetical protein SLNWT_0123 [Streptomyces albus]|uniref:Uncharacterized protein n=1 Tax=Streptomyces albus (strain ATCC 21838 / DSM 41398 / FERM P-419 / JCM 4703 / NBRC 107858) TaxID=1081613 RepID=A0A0B5EGN1_STRA4|nr:hypothetical protein SLNWT_0123 [Streptomyces albus]AOU74817.1 hypothetical protein SLNHY_0126 [Streptomyces albus]AYN30629.1 hypothetical protein DUI70_0126 [Streptomyces albus]
MVRAALVGDLPSAPACEEEGEELPRPLRSGLAKWLVIMAVLLGQPRDLLGETGRFSMPIRPGEQPVEQTHRLDQPLTPARIVLGETPAPCGAQRT